MINFGSLGTRAQKYMLSSLLDHSNSVEQTIAEVHQSIETYESC